MGVHKAVVPEGEVPVTLNYFAQMEKGDYVNLLGSLKELGVLPVENRSVFSAQDYVYNGIHTRLSRPGTRGFVNAVLTFTGGLAPGHVAVLKKEFGGLPRQELEHMSSTSPERFEAGKEEGRERRNRLGKGLKGRQKLRSFYGIKGSPAEPEEVDKIMTAGFAENFKNAGYLKGWRGLSYYVRDTILKGYRRYFKTQTVLTKPLSNKEERVSRLETQGFVRKYSLGLDSKDVVSFMRTMRSLFMASELVRVSRESGKPAVLVCGGGHASQVHKFVENPEMALRYLRVLRKKLKYSVESQLHEPLSQAEKEFALLDTEKRTG